MDRSFWSLHDNVATYFVLGLPTLGGLTLLGVALAAIVRSYDLDAGLGYFLWGLATPVACLTVFTFGPLPCSVFAWSQAQGEPRSIAGCFAGLTARAGRLLKVGARLLFSFSWWTFLLGIPFLILWPRTCMAPMVALFENQRRVFWRSRKLMQEDHAIFMLAGLYFVMTVVLGILIFLPRALVSSRLLSLPWLVEFQDSLWAFELVSAVLLLTGIAVSWCVALTLFYHDLRYHREGEGLRAKVELLADKYSRRRGPA
jgi:hypothetical protein